LADRELVHITITLIALFAASAAKAVTARLIRRLEVRIAEIRRERARAEGQLAQVQAQTAVMAKNKIALERKKARLLKKLDKMAEDLDMLVEAANNRQQLNDKMRGGLIRPTRAARITPDS